MAMTRSQFAAYFTRGLKEVFSTSYKELDSVYDKIFNIESSDKNYEEVLGMVGFGYLAATGEMEDATLQDAIEGFKTRATHVKYSLGYRISNELVDDDMYGLVRQFPQALARSARATMDKVSADIFNLGFAGGATLADGQQLFSTAHPMKRGGTFANKQTVDADLGFTALKQALIDLRKIHDDSDVPISGANDVTLLVPGDLEFDAAEIIKSVERPDTANRAANAIAKQRRWNLVVWDYLSDPDAWFVLYPKDQHKLICFVRKAIEQEAQNDVLNDSWKHVARYRKSVIAADARGLWGSAGA